MIIKKCKNCSRKFRARRQTTAYCSLKCMRAYVPHLISNSRKGMKFSDSHRNSLVLAHKNKEYGFVKGYKMPEKWKKEIAKKQTGNNNSNWKGGRMINGGYILILMPYHPFNNKGYVFEHRYIVEQCLKRYLENNEIIHHINGIKSDNRPENLYLCSSVKEHFKAHKFKVKSNII